MANMKSKKAPISGWRCARTRCRQPRGPGGIFTVLAVLLALLLPPVTGPLAAERIIFGVHPYKPAVEL